MHRGARKLGRAAEAAEARIEGAAEDGEAAFQRGGVERRRRARSGATSACFFSCSTTSRADSSIFSRSLAPGLRDLRQDGAEARMAPAVLGRKVGAAEERLAVPA